MLVEVMIGALLVALVVVATLTRCARSVVPR
jgi:hypothetical protein